MPSVRTAVSELERFMDLAEDRTAVLREEVFGDGHDGEPAVRVRPSGARPIALVLADVCTRLAAHCGDLATVNARLGCAKELEEPAPPPALGMLRVRT